MTLQTLNSLNNIKDNSGFLQPNTTFHSPKDNSALNNNFSKTVNYFR